MLAHTPFDDGRGRYPDKLTLQVPRGFRDLVREVAEAERLSMGELIRRAVEAHVAAVRSGRDNTARAGVGA